MDPYSAEGELINIHNHFHQGQYQEVIDFDTSSLSAENALPARVLQLRARVALGQAEDVLADVQGESEPELEAVGALAEQALGNSEVAVKTIQKLVASSADNATVQVLGGTVLQTAGNSEEALALLSQHQGNCKLWTDVSGVVGGGSWLTLGFCLVEAVALIVQIHLQQNRNDLAVKEVAAARRWAQDSLLVNLAESWVGLRLVGFPVAAQLTWECLLMVWCVTGWREVPAGFLRLRGVGTSTGDIVSADPGRPGGCGASPWTDRRGRAGAGPGTEEGTRVCRGYCQLVGSECDHRKGRHRVDTVFAPSPTNVDPPANSLSAPWRR